MKKNLSFIIIFLFLSFSGTLKAQSFNVISGDLSQLKNDNSLNVEFTFDHMAIGQMSSEADYIAKKVKEHNDKVPGKGDKWLTEWNDNKTNLFAPGFLTFFNKAIKKYKVVADRNLPQAKYTMVVNTTFLEIGFSGWSYANKAAEIRLELTFYEGNSLGKMIGKMTVQGLYGSTSDYSYTSGVRIASAYQVAGLAIGKYLAKKVYK